MDHDHDHDHDHGHDHGLGVAAGMRAGAAHRNRLAICLVLTAAFFVVEVIAGFATNSLSLLSDAGHMLTDVVGLGIALAAIQLATRFEQREASATSSSHSFGLYRLEILAAFVNSLLLFGVAIWVLVEAFRRFGDGPEVLSTPMLVVALLGLAVNAVAFALLRQGAKESINVEGAYLEVLADAVGSIGVVVAALSITWFGWTWMDPLIGAAIGLWILPRTWRLGRRSARVLLQAAPDHVPLDVLHLELAGLDGVVDVHDLHVWTLTSDMEAASAHLMVADDADAHAVLDQARELLVVRYGIDHGTFQVEPESHTGCHDVSW